MKNLFKVGLLTLIALLWLPTDPISDMLLIPAIIAAVGFELYMIISILLVVYLYNTIEGRTLGQKLKVIQHEAGQIFK